MKSGSASIWQAVRDFWLEWLALMTSIASLILVIVEAVPETPGKAIGFWLSSYVCLFVAAALVFYRMHARLKAVETTQAERDRLRSVRDRLADLLDQGEKLKQQCGRNQGTLLSDEEAQAWMASAESVIAEGLGASYLVRFRNDTGLPNVFAPLESEPQGQLWYAIHFRTLRLLEFIQGIERTALVI